MCLRSVFWLHSRKVLAQRIRYRDYTVWMTLQGTKSRITTFRLRHTMSYRSHNSFFIRDESSEIMVSLISTVFLIKNYSFKKLIYSAICRQKSYRWLYIYNAKGNHCGDDFGIEVTRDCSKPQNHTKEIIFGRFRDVEDILHTLSLTSFR